MAIGHGLAFVVCLSVRVRLGHQESENRSWGMVGVVWSGNEVRGTHEGS